MELPFTIIGSMTAVVAVTVFSPYGKAVIYRWLFRVSDGVRTCGLNTMFIMLGNLRQEWWWLRNQKLDLAVRVRDLGSDYWRATRRRDACVSLFPDPLSWAIIAKGPYEHGASVQMPENQGRPVDSPIDLPVGGTYVVEIRLSWAFVTIHHLQLFVTVDQEMLQVVSYR